MDRFHVAEFGGVRRPRRTDKQEQEQDQAQESTGEASLPRRYRKIKRLTQARHTIFQRLTEMVVLQQ